MKTYIFPGQGSHYVGMGKKLFKQFPHMVEQANEVLGYSIRDLCLNDSCKQLNQTQFTQPALYTVSVLAYLQHQQDNPTPADFFAGHSLGEYCALFAGGAFSFEAGLKLVKKRGELMSQAASGAMAAVLNVEEVTLRSNLHENQLTSVDIANLNAPDQIVISGPTADIQRCQPMIEQLGGRFIKLNTSGAFHSRYMAPAQQEFARYIQAFNFSALHTPVIANVTAQPMASHDIAKLLIAQITQPVKWTQSIEFLLTQGEMTFTELGPKKVLTKLIQSIQTNVALVTQHKSVTPVSATDKTLTPQQQVTHWNRIYPIGTEVKINGKSDLYTTRTNASLLFGHRPAIYLHGFHGYFHLHELSAMPQTAHAAKSA
ncbi:ACP S-malonyltransferase [Pseudoalteromonas sp. SMS1]|uniref:ACP S-malonyltransferase n=1 Tax=Pseudoalteromonas sp. SMS1 TaxID=2908894 RepID=UPI001F2E917C|nr:ACP S-malonyltransferase [Pseudoalteromonas sp. SMS1]MCF2860139.1 ACP S-malonyltransferase [Pseudoalteromonas sp. SMS1]